MKTHNGYPCDEVISALQKDIRRGNGDDAGFWAYELAISGYGKKLWERLAVICAEDIGLSDPYSMNLIRSAHEEYLTLDEKSGDATIICIFAAVYLAGRPKSRIIDDMYSCFRKRLVDYPAIPDYAIDKHTARGKNLGKGIDHFYDIGAVIKAGPKMIPLKSPNSYRERILIYARNIAEADTGKR